VRLNLSKLPKQLLSRSEAFIKRRKLLLLLAGAVILAACSISYEVLTTHHTVASNSQKPVQAAQNNQAKNVLDQAGQSLIDHHDASQGGWRFKSEIQSPHYQTDRDVGAASVGMGFLAMAEADPNNSQWVNAAKQTANWLTVVSKQNGKGGRYWPDYVDDNDVSTDVYTSFDDGTIGISDFFWRLYEKTGDPKYKQVSIEGLQWTLSQAEPYGQNSYRWK
jgi:hypothetical protein